MREILAQNPGTVGRNRQAVLQWAQAACTPNNSSLEAHFYRLEAILGVKLGARRPALCMLLEALARTPLKVVQPPFKRRRVEHSDGDSTPVDSDSEDDWVAETESPLTACEQCEKIAYFNRTVDTEALDKVGATPAIRPDCPAHDHAPGYAENEEIAAVRATLDALQTAKRHNRYIDLTTPVTFIPPPIKVKAEQK